MKQLQNNFTTPEQSKRLLELGVPADSADCCYEYFNGSQEINPPFFLDCNFSEYHNVMDDDGLVSLPCWSVGRLIEIFLLCSPYKSIEINKSDKVEQMIVSMENEHILLDFSKLEE